MQCTIGFTYSRVVSQGELPDYLHEAIEFRLLLYAARQLEFYNADVSVSLAQYFWYKKCL